MAYSNEESIDTGAESNRRLALQNQFLDDMRSFIMRWARESDLGTIDVMGCLQSLSVEVAMQTQEGEET